MENPRVIEVFDRLRQALKLASDKDLAEALGLAYQAFSKRKLRGSMPQEEVETVIEQRGLNAAWVYTGEGPMFEGGEAQARREQEWHELKEQLRAMSLHNQTRSAIEPLVKGIVWGDAPAIERWVEEIGGLSQEERQIVAAYRTGGAEVQAALALIARTGAAPTKVTQTFHGKVGQVLEGSQTFHGDVTIGINSSRKK
jgi:hypothetical protein